MNKFQVEALVFTFGGNWAVVKYDDWTFYVQEFQHVCGGAKAVDLVAISPDGCCWLIEAKDYRQGHQTTTIAVAEDVAQKFRDTLAGLATACLVATGEDKVLSGKVFKCGTLRLVFHMEQPPTSSPLFPTALDPAKVKQKLRQLVRSMDRKLDVVDVAQSVKLPWTVLNGVRP